MDRRNDDLRRPQDRTDAGARTEFGREAGRNAGAAPVPRTSTGPRASVPPGPGVGGGIPGAAKSPEVVGEEVLHAHPGPGAVVIGEDEFRERMDEETVDGRPPEKREQRRAQAFFWVMLAAVSVAVIGVLWYYAGFVPALLGLFLAALFISLAAWPTWHAAMDRKIDEAKVKREVVDEHLHSGPGNTAGPGAA